MFKVPAAMKKRGSGLRQQVYYVHARCGQIYKTYTRLELDSSEVLEIFSFLLWHVASNVSVSTCVTS